MNIEIEKLSFAGCPVMAHLDGLTAKETYEITITKEGQTVFAERYEPFGTTLHVDIAEAVAPYVAKPALTEHFADVVTPFDPQGHFAVACGAASTALHILPGGSIMGNAGYAQWRKKRVPLLVSGYDGTLVHYYRRDLLPVYVMGGESVTISTEYKTQTFDLKQYEGQIVALDLDAFDKGMPLYTISQPGKTPMKIGVKPDVEGKCTSVVSYRNSFGVWERITLVGGVNISETSSSQQAEVLKSYDVMNAVYSERPSRSSRKRQYTVNTGYLHPEIYSVAISDMLRSDEVLLKLDSFVSPVQCAVACEDFLAFTSEDNTTPRGLDLVFTELREGQYV